MEFAHSPQVYKRIRSILIADAEESRTGYGIGFAACYGSEVIPGLYKIFGIGASYKPFLAVGIYQDGGIVQCDSILKSGQCDEGNSTLRFTN